MRLTEELYYEYLEHLKKEYRNNIGELPELEGDVLDDFFSRSNEFCEYMSGKLILIYMNESTYNDLLEQSEIDEEYGVDLYAQVLEDLRNHKFASLMRFESKIIINDADEEFSFQSARFVCRLQRKKGG
jgi:hypothetical protein